LKKKTQGITLTEKEIEEIKYELENNLDVGVSLEHFLLLFEAELDLLDPGSYSRDNEKSINAITRLRTEVEAAREIIAKGDSAVFRKVLDSFNSPRMTKKIFPFLSKDAFQELVRNQYFKYNMYRAPVALPNAEAMLKYMEEGRIKILSTSSEHEVSQAKASSDLNIATTGSIPSPNLDTNYPTLGAASFGRTRVDIPSKNSLLAADMSHNFVERDMESYLIKDKTRFAPKRFS